MITSSIVQFSIKVDSSNRGTILIDEGAFTLQVFVVGSSYTCYKIPAGEMGGMCYHNVNGKFIDIMVKGTKGTLWSQHKLWLKVPRLLETIAADEKAEGIGVYFDIDVITGMCCRSDNRKAAKALRSKCVRFKRAVAPVTKVALLDAFGI